MSGTSCSQRNPSQWKNVTPHTNKKALNTARDKRISADSLIKLAEFVLKNNIFEHNKSVFKELRGTAIGTKMAPPYAIIFMGSLEENIPSNGLLKFLVWLLTSMILLWCGKMEKMSLKKFLEFLYCHHPTIKFTAEYSGATINFLDVTVLKKSNQLVTSFYLKPTDKHQELHASSCHISHCKKSKPFSQMLHINKIFLSENIILINDVMTWRYG